MQSVVYGIGGYDPAAPAENRLELWDSDTATYTRWDDTGAVVEQRPLTDEELAADQSAPPKPDIQQLADQLASLTGAVDELILNALMGL